MKWCYMHSSTSDFRGDWKNTNSQKESNNTYRGTPKRNQITNIENIFLPDKSLYFAQSEKSFTETRQKKNKIKFITILVEIQVNNELRIHRVYSLPSV